LRSMLPRQILPNSTTFISRRCTQGMMLLAPNSRLNKALRYCVAVVAAETGVSVHGCTVMSNHWHAVITDIHARLPEFTAGVHRLMALCVNALRNRKESLWSSAKPSYVRPETPEDALSKLIYSLANPVAAQLVNTAREWRGFSTAAEPYGKIITVKRADLFFSKNGIMPESVQLELKPIPGFDHLTGAMFGRLVRRRLRHRERELGEERRRLNRPVLGPVACSEVDPFSSSRHEPPAGALSPRIAALDRSIRIAALARIRQFVLHYRAARARWCGGDRDVTFPAGTYWLRRHANVRCHEA